MVDPDFNIESPFGFFPRSRGTGSGGSATGEVGNITSAAGRAGKYLSTAGEAIGSGGQGGGLTDAITMGQGPRRDMFKKGGKVKKKKSPTIKVRGAGKAIKGVRPAKMVKMKGS
tara:strand:+ start:455 stop:796 length:342 start_codon:yes stop_codon:yes gene_type:complete